MSSHKIQGLLSQRIPEIADPKKGDAIKRGLVEAGTHYGFSEAELGNVRDHRYILAMYDAMRYRNLVKKRGNATSPKKESITPVKAGQRNALQPSKQMIGRKQNNAFKRVVDQSKARLILF